MFVFYLLCSQHVTILFGIYINTTVFHKKTNQDDDSLKTFPSCMSDSQLTSSTYSSIYLNTIYMCR